MTPSGRPYREVAEALRTLIADGPWRAGDRIMTERQLADRLGIGRALVREAVIMLEVEGMLEARRGSGIYLLRPAGPGPAGSAGDIGPFELLQARQVLESAVAAQAALGVTKADIRRMQAALDQERAEIDAEIDAGPDTGTDHAASHAADRLFHRLIAEATQNAALVDAVDRLWAQRDASPMWARLHARIGSTDYRRRWSDDHGLILASLQRKDADGARRRMWQHLDNVRHTLLALTDPEEPGFDAFLFPTPAPIHAGVPAPRRQEG